MKFNQIPQTPQITISEKDNLFNKDNLNLCFFEYKSKLNMNSGEMQSIVLLIVQVTKNKQKVSIEQIKMFYFDYVIENKKILTEKEYFLLTKFINNLKTYYNFIY